MDWRLWLYRPINALLRKLMSANYRANYLRSNDWRERSAGFVQAHLMRHPEDRGKALHVHHLNYNNIGHEMLGRDVEVITREEHMRIHAARRAVAV